MSQQNPFVGKWQILSADGTTPISFMNNTTQANTFTVYQAGPFDAINRVTPVYWIFPNTQGGITPLNDPGTQWLTTYKSNGNIVLGFDTNSESAVLQLNADLSVPRLPGSQNPPPGTDQSFQYLGLLEGFAGSGVPSIIWLCWGSEGETIDPYSIQVVTSGMITVNSDNGSSCTNKVSPNKTTDFTYIDISGENYSYLQLTGSDFRNSLCTDTDFSSSQMGGAFFGDAGSYKYTSFYVTELTGATFSGGDFTEATFQLAILDGAHFTNCCLRQVSFQNATLRNCTFTDCDLTEACFYDLVSAGSLSFFGCTLDRAQFQAFSNPSNDLSGVSFVGAKSMIGCNFTNTILHGTNFDKVLLSQADFTGADFTGALLTNVDLSTAIFSPAPSFSKDPAQPTNMAGSTVNVASLGADWSNMILSKATILGLPFGISSLKARNTVFNNVQLTGSNLQSADFTNANLQFCNMSDCNLSDGVFNGAQLQGDINFRAAVLSNVQLMNADFTNANLTGTQFSGAFLSGANFSNAIVIRTNFTAAYLTGVQFVGLNDDSCQGSNFGKACLINASFKGTDCTAYEGQPTSFASSCLQGADFTGAKLSEADLTNAAMSADTVEVAVTIPIGWPGQPVTLSISAAATLGVQAATDYQSTCPNGLKGPCSARQQQAPEAPTAWP